MHFGRSLPRMVFPISVAYTDPFGSESCFVVNRAIDKILCVKGSGIRATTGLDRFQGQAPSGGDGGS